MLARSSLIAKASTFLTRVLTDPDSSVLSPLERTTFHLHPLAINTYLPSGVTEAR